VRTAAFACERPSADGKPRRADWDDEEQKHTHGVLVLDATSSGVAAACPQEQLCARPDRGPTRRPQFVLRACSALPPETPPCMGEQVSVVARLLRKPRAAASGCIVRKPGAHAYTGEPTRTCRDCEMTVAEIEVKGRHDHQGQIGRPGWCGVGHLYRRGRSERAGHLARKRTGGRRAHRGNSAGSRLAGVRNA
jgi:hypothetical protein